MQAQPQRSLTLGAADTLLLRDLLDLISTTADLRLYKWREWLQGEIEDAQLADALDELLYNLNRYGAELAQVSAKLREPRP